MPEKFQKLKNMEIIAQSKSVRISPRKVSLVAKALKNLSIDKALQVLSVTQKRASSTLEKTIKSAVANAVNNAKLNRDLLVIDRIEVSPGQALKRYHPSSRGRVHPYKKKSSHIRVVLKEKEIKKEVTNGAKS